MRELDQMALAPCHAFFQFYVRNGELSCQLYQRVPTCSSACRQYVSYALLLDVVLSRTEASEFVHTFGDLQLYSNHLEQAQEQLSREPRQRPVMTESAVTNIHDFVFEDFTLHH